ncbi:transcriptional regulator [Streptomyces zinciresistens K42]|uniref:Transcriptional regulator n=1 Tax=Streptomyces zinciresistens K42 TaxID=700597 RepID=G2G5L2_9ACTN|nr:transcriptional regulator [Streptomyces zinciresistens K42]
MREDLLELARQARDATFSRPGLALRAVIHECDGTEAERFHAAIFEGVVEPTIRLLREFIMPGVERGEPHKEAAGDYVVDAVPAMRMYRSKMCASEWNDQDLEEMIDQLILPLPRPAGG